MVEMFRQMLYADALRGWDSTGIIAIKDNYTVHIEKDACPPGQFFARIPKERWDVSNAALIGHNRWATRGARTAANAHPFQEGHVSLVHNGTLYFHHQLKNVEVDSHAICHAINEQGIVPTLEKLDGAFALMWYDSITQIIHATRNKERPLFIIETDAMFVLCSEKELGLWICTRNNVKVKKAYPMNPGVLYSWKKNKKNQLYINTVGYKLLIKPMYIHKPYVPMTAGDAAQQEGKIIPFVAKKFLPAVFNHEANGYIVGDKIEAIAYQHSESKYYPFDVGPHKWECEFIGDANIVVDFYTKDHNIDFTDCMVSLEIMSIRHSSHTNTTFIVGRNPTLVEKKSVADKKGPIISSNGIAITEQVAKGCEDLLCTFCETPFEIHAGSSIIPTIKHGHVYKYTYYCENCSPMFVTNRSRISGVHAHATK